MDWQLPRLSAKRMAALAHDLVMTGVAIVICYVARFGTAAFTERLDEMALLAALILPTAAVIYQLFGLYSAVWRFASTPDLLSVLKAVTALAAIMAVFDFATRGGIMVPRTIVGLFWFVSAALLAGPRLVFRSYRDQHLRTYSREPEGTRVPTLVLGTGREAEVLIRSLETDPAAVLTPVGLLALKSRHVGQRIRGVPILGTDEELPAVVARLQASAAAPIRLVVTEEAFREQARVERAVASARSLGLSVERLAPVVKSGPGTSRPRLTEIDIADMRPRAGLDRRAFSALVAGKRVAVTGGGGVVGAEICRQAAAARCERLLVVENAELALYECRRLLRAEQPDLAFEAALCDVTDREAIAGLLGGFKPDIVFHAAAMKHEATIARQLPTAISVNLGGTINVADAAIAAGAAGVVLVSTDQAEGPATAMGATRRLAELYLQLVAGGSDRDGHGERGEGAIRTRFVSVRFPQVYSARGATVSAIRSQIARGGPVTLPPGGEAGLLVALDDAMTDVLRAAARTLARGDGHAVVGLDLGEPVLLEAVAERMVRLAGLEPGTDIRIVGRPAPAVPGAAAELRARVAALADRAATEPHFVLREILALAQAAGEEEISGRIGPVRGLGQPYAGTAAGRLH